jgi:hypothetical protein
MSKSLIETGKTICDNNMFFHTLRLVLKYILQGITKGSNVLDLVKQITKSEMDFRVYTIYKDYGIYLYTTKINFMFNHGDNIDDVTYALIAEIKTTYDLDHKVLEPYVSKLDFDTEKLNHNYHYMKAIPTQFLETETILKKSLSLLEEADKLEEQAREFRRQGISLLKSTITMSKKEILLLEA